MRLKNWAKRHLLICIFVALLLGLAIAEASARLLLGLGTPPLSITDPAIEYMFAPNQDVSRFGNRQLYNEYGMRSPSLRDVDHGRRILVLGDSVINGGNLTDHQDLATTLATDEGTFYGNVSAGMWGPANMRGWLERFGLLGSDTVILVLNSDDLNDVPTFSPLDPQTHPKVRPTSALLEGIQKYLPLYLPLAMGKIIQPHQNQITDQRPSASEGSDEITKLIDRVRRDGAKLCLIQHLTLQELRSAPLPEYKAIRDIFLDRQVPVLNFGNALKDAIGAGEKPFRDALHISEFGQTLLVGYLKRCAGLAKIPT